MNGSEGFLPKNQNFTMKVARILWYRPKSKLELMGMLPSLLSTTACPWALWWRRKIDFIIATLKLFAMTANLIYLRLQMFVTNGPKNTKPIYSWDIIVRSIWMQTPWLWNHFRYGSEHEAFHCLSNEENKCRCMQVLNWLTFYSKQHFNFCWNIFHNWLKCSIAIWSAYLLILVQLNV